MSELSKKEEKLFMKLSKLEMTLRSKYEGSRSGYPGLLSKESSDYVKTLWDVWNKERDSRLIEDVPNLLYSVADWPNASGISYNLRRFINNYNYLDIELCTVIDFTNLMCRVAKKSEVEKDIKGSVGIDMNMFMGLLMFGCYKGKICTKEEKKKEALRMIDEMSFHWYRKLDPNYKREEVELVNGV